MLSGLGRISRLPTLNVDILRTAILGGFHSLFDLSRMFITTAPSYWAIYLPGIKCCSRRCSTGGGWSGHILIHTNAHVSVHKREVVTARLTAATAVRCDHGTHNHPWRMASYTAVWSRHQVLGRRRRGHGRHTRPQGQSTSSRMQESCEGLVLLKQSSRGGTLAPELKFCA